jgi:hypothetical protein
VQLEFNGVKPPKPVTAEKYKKVKELLAKGDISPSKACEKIGMAWPTYTEFKKNHDSPKEKKTYNKKPKFVDIQLHQEPDDKMIVVVCKSSQLKNILENLK